MAFFLDFHFVSLGHLKVSAAEELVGGIHLTDWGLFKVSPVHEGRTSKGPLLSETLCSHRSTMKVVCKTS